MSGVPIERDLGIHDGRYRAGVRWYSTATLTAILVGSVVGAARGHLGSGLVYGVPALGGLLWTAWSGRRAGKPPGANPVLAGMVVSTTVLVAGTVFLIVAAIRERSDDRGALIGMAILAGNFTALCLAMAVWSYRSLRRTAGASDPPHSVWEEFESANQSEAATTPPDLEPYPETPRRTRARRWFGAIATVGAAGVLLARSLGDGPSILAGVLGGIGFVLLACGGLGYWWAGAWVFKDED